jgi:hypothetical protein
LEAAGLCARRFYLKSNDMSKTKKKFLEHCQFPDLAKAVINQIGLPWDELSSRPSDFFNASYGVSGFIYYSDTHEFTKKNRKNIVAMLEEQADQMGEDVVAMVNGFGVFRPDGMDNDDKKDLYRLLGGGLPAQGPITNVMAWYALEETMHQLDYFMNE